MSSIEEDIKILNKFNEYENSVVLTDNALFEIQQAIENVLDLIKRTKNDLTEMIKDLEEVNFDGWADRIRDFDIMYESEE